jgi:hypothetical protein
LYLHVELGLCLNHIITKGKARKGKERKGKERKGKERKGKERKGKERKGNPLFPTEHLLSHPAF